MRDFMDAYLALWAFIVAMVATPGPANMLLMTAGAQQGYVRTLPFIAGLLAGKLTLNLALAFGLMQIIDANPDIKSVFVFVSAAYMAYLALRNWTPPSASSSQSRFSFWAGALVHPLSPKTWMMATLALSQFADGFATDLERMLVVPISFLAVQLCFHSLWCLAGAALSRALDQNLVVHRALILLTLGVIVWAVSQ